MGMISDNDRSVFREAAQTVHDEFEERDLVAISELANQLRIILEMVKKRQQLRLSRKYRQ